MASIVGHTQGVNNAIFDKESDLVYYLIADSGVLSYAGSLDVVAHEWAHGITKYMSNLRGRREAGALNESFSDMFGVAVEWANGSQNWVIAETSYNNLTNPPDYLHSLYFPPSRQQAETWGEGWWKNPRLTGPDSCPNPDTTNDSCWVTRNMGIPNKMFYLLANGGFFNNVTVTGIGIQNAMAIMFRATFQKYWKDSIDFARAATGSIKAAFELNYVSSWPQQTSKAWTAVKVCDTMPGDANGSGGIAITDVIYLVNYVFDKSRVSPPCNGTDPGTCWPIDPNCQGELNGDISVNIQDVIWLVNYVFDKSRDNPYCEGANPINCWLPIPTDVCCKLP